MHWIFIFLYVYSLTLQVSSGENTYCRFNDLQTFATTPPFKPINTDEYNSNCLKFPTFNATIRQGSLHVEGCANAEYRINTNAPEWHVYKTPVPLTNGQSVRVRCGHGDSILLVNPPMVVKQPLSPPSKTPSVFVVMIDAVSYEALHRLMPNTVAALKHETDVDVYEFTKYPPLLKKNIARYTPL